MKKYIATFQTLNLGLFTNIKKIFENWVSESQFKIQHFCCLPDLKSSWNNLWVLLANEVDTKKWVLITEFHANSYVSKDCPKNHNI